MNSQPIRGPCDQSLRRDESIVEVMLHLSESQLADLEAVAQCRGLTLGGLLRRLIRDFLMRVNDAAVLRGHTHTYYAKQLAQQAVLDMASRPIVANEIEVS